METCENWLQQFLTEHGMTNCEEIRDAAKRQGYSKRQLKEARKSLRVETINDWAANEGETLNWFWRLPQ